MHEMALAESMLQIVQDHAAEAGARRVLTVRLELGQLAGVDPEAMRFCFDAVVRDSVAQGAQLIIDEVPGSAWCMACGTTVPLPDRTRPCPRCDGFQLQPTGGTLMRLKELEVE